MKTYESNYAKDTRHKIITADRYWRCLTETSFPKRRRLTDVKINPGQTLCRDVKKRIAAMLDTRQGLFRMRFM